MKRWFFLLLIMLAVFLAATPVLAATQNPAVRTPVTPIIPETGLIQIEPQKNQPQQNQPQQNVSQQIGSLQIGPQQILTPIIPVNAPVLVAFSAVPNRYTGVDPATVFDLDGDLVGDISVDSNTVTAKNGAKVQLLSPAQLNLDNVQSVPSGGYSTSAALQLSRVYAAQLPGGGYAKFLILQATPKVSIWFNYGIPTTSELKADGTGGHAKLSWGALPDATLGYDIYRYEISDNASYTVTQLNDFTVQETSFVDDTAQKSYYLYVVQAIKSGGSPGGLTTVAPVYVQSVQRKLQLPLTTNTAKLDGVDLPLDATPVIKNGWMMVPATVFSKISTNVTFDGTTGHIILSRRIGNTTYKVEMTLDDSQYTWNGTTYKSDVPPYKNGNVVMVPLRALAPVLGYGVSFDSTTRTATVQWAE